MTDDVIYATAEKYAAGLELDAARIADELGIDRRSFAEQHKGEDPASVIKAIAERTAK